MRHGYTNSTVRIGATVRKRYAGPRAAERAEREYAALTAIAGSVPVPAVLGRAPGTLTLEFVAGGPGQDLIAAGHAARVLAACGGVLRRIHSAGFRHGDFGPNNTLLDPNSLLVTAVLDWEFSSTGVDPVVDLSWCEWIVRMHHPGETAAIPSLYSGYGTSFSWSDRQAAMVDRCAELIEFTHEWEPGGPAEVLWRERLRVTAGW
ncbi:phosphotransferase [Pseudonocardia adelaidensis]|uniref:Aminoglycoside phosphotransferase domain-containing protein n=1 Tax=Pseudonocardia adelaidensis TaxID=648754 RepID=A0ABP9NNM6_9PSEU